MAQRNIEILIGRLVTDEAFRQAFVTDASTTIRRFIESGHELTHTEIDALTTTQPAVWSRAADEIDPRLQKVFLNS